MDPGKLKDQENGPCQNKKFNENLDPMKSFSLEENLFHDPSQPTKIENGNDSSQNQTQRN